jgi:hypothetical protein
MPARRRVPQAPDAANGSGMAATAPVENGDAMIDRQEVTLFADALDAFILDWWGRIEYQPAPEIADRRLPHLDRRHIDDWSVDLAFTNLRTAALTLRVVLVEDDQ